MLETEHITLLQLQQQIKAKLEGAMPSAIWVSAEVADAKVNSSGHCYIDLVEKGDGEEGVAPKAQVKATIWRATYATIARNFKAQTGGDIARGMKILALVNVNFHPVYGLSLQISNVDPTYTVGDIERQKRETIERLQKEGVWDINRSHTMPYVPQRIAVISSKTAAGYQDFTAQIASSPYSFAITLFDSPVQGDTAEAGIIESLNKIAEREAEFDAVALIRGGGSTTDLGCFNSYLLNFYLAQFPLPIITGIGHERDESIADMVAHTHLKTPTAVAVWLIERLEKVDSWLLGVVNKITKDAQDTIHKGELALNQWGGELKLETSKLLDRQTMNLKTMGIDLEVETSKLLDRQTMWLTSSQEQIEGLANGLLHLENERVKALMQTIESHSPKHILSKGFSIVRMGANAITSKSEVGVGDKLTVTLSDGDITTEVVDN